MKLTRTLVLSLALIPTTAACGGADSEEAIAAATAELEQSSFCSSMQKLEPGVFSTDADEGRLVFSIDGKSAYFHRVNAQNVLTLMESHVQPSGKWSPPVPVAFASGYDELDPYLSPDEDALYYASFRPVDGPTPRGDSDLWKVERVGDGWSDPIHLGPEVNTVSMELFPSMTLDGALYFNSDRPGGVGAWDIYLAPPAPGGFQPAALLPGDVNSGIWEFNPSPSPLGRVLAFASLDPDPAAPYSDVFFSMRVHGEYSARVSAGPCVNGVGPEFHPTLDWPRKRLVFVRADPATGGDFYAVNLPNTRTFADTAP
jgi:WD40-like Beta Propeller Repeat